MRGSKAIGHRIGGAIHLPAHPPIMEDRGAGQGRRELCRTSIQTVAARDYE